MVETRKETSAWKEKFLLWMVAVYKNIFRILFTVLHRGHTGIHWTHWSVHWSTAKKGILPQDWVMWQQSKMDSFSLSAGVPRRSQDQMLHFCLRYIFPKMYPNGLPTPLPHRKSWKVWKPSLVAKHSCRRGNFQDSSKRLLTLKGQDNVRWERDEGKSNLTVGQFPDGYVQLKHTLCFWGLSLYFSHHCASPTLQCNKKLKPLLFKYPPHNELHYPSYFQGSLS